jgi:TM2 domain-containing membrane protein YozV
MGETDNVPGKAGTAAARPNPADSLLEQEAGRRYRQGDYFEASILYERILFQNSLSATGSGSAGGSSLVDTSVVYRSVIGKIQCLKRQGFYEQAEGFINTWLPFPFADTCQIRLQTQQVLCSYLGGHFENVISLADRWPYLHPGKTPEPILPVLKILSLNELQRWTEADSSYRLFMAGSPVANPYQELPRLKSVKKAQWLSTFIPGGGQFYAGKPGEALVSLLIQGLGIYIGIVSIERHYYVTAWLVGAALFGSFHQGSVRRSEQLVQQYNRRKALQFNERVREQLIGSIQ